MEYKIPVIAEPKAIIQLGLNPEFRSGRTLKQILKHHANIFLIMDEDEFDRLWRDSEYDVRKFFIANDLPRPRALSLLQKVYAHPELSYQISPFAIWLLSNADSAERFKKYFGVWAVEASSVDDRAFSMKYSPNRYEQGERIEGYCNNGWGNYFERLTQPLPPMNSMVINDRFLLNAYVHRFGTRLYGLNNLKCIIDSILPDELRIPFHILVFCEHPDIDIVVTNNILYDFIETIKGLRTYEIKIDFVFAPYQPKLKRGPLHARFLFANYSIITADRGFDAFKVSNAGLCTDELCSENKICVESYLNDPFASGDIGYSSARNDIDTIKGRCEYVFNNPTIEPSENKMIERCFLTGDELNHRFFS